jgi:hypothetical protein
MAAITPNTERFESVTAGETVEEWLESIIGKV